MDRRHFLERFAKLLGWLAAAPTFSRCGSSYNNAQGTTYTSSAGGTDNHTHTFVLPTSAVQSPANGYSGTTSATDSHTHSVTIPSSQLSSIAGGTAVTVTTTTDSTGHQHAFTL